MTPKWWCVVCRQHFTGDPKWHNRQHRRKRPAQSEKENQ